MIWAAKRRSLSLAELAIIAAIVLVVGYLVLWVIMPERAQDRPAGRSSFDSMADDVRRAA